uniref:HTH_Tnp_Tc3_2 domain-containing protein n=1 Tax=Caenorhabditis japonica TaxID=281687 RepID=A0A8R1HT81_CAEJA
MDRNILRAWREDHRRTSTDIQVSVTSPNKPVPSKRTIRRSLQVAGLHGRIPVKKPLSNLFGTDGIQWIRRPIGSRFAPQYQCPTVKYGGGSVMVWGCFSDTSMGSLNRIVGTMDRYVYEDILENTMRPWARANLGRSWVFQQEMTRSMLRVMSPIGFDVTVWISWNGQELERRLKEVRASNANQKFAQLEAAWKSIPMTVVQTLLDSMPRRCQAVIDAKAYPTKY